MVVRLSAVLCGVAVMLALSAATAKSPTNHANSAPSKKSAKIAPAPPAKPVLDANGQVANPLAGHVFVSRRAPYLCAPRTLSFTARFRDAQIAISTSILKQTDMEDLGIAIIGAASMYNPFRPGYQTGGIETASGELYDPAAWTAAIQSDLRGDFGGVRYGKDYRPVFALVESGGKRVVVKINDVGPLLPGRVVDLNQQVMHYFDPSLQHGLVRDIQITPLPGRGWVPGPVEDGMQVLSAREMQAWSVY